MGTTNSQLQPNNVNGAQTYTTEAPVGCELRCEGWKILTPISSWSISAMVYSDNVVVPPPGPGEVRVKLYAASLNPVDVKRATFGRCGGFFGFSKGGNSSIANFGFASNRVGSNVGKSVRYPSPEFPFPYVMGTDGAGVVESVGWNNDDPQQREAYGLQVGDRVAFVADITSATGGSFSQYAVVHADAVGKIPTPTTDDVIDFVEAAAIPCAVGAAYIALFDKMRVSSGRTILINGASGGVGSAAVQLAKYAGLFVLASCSTVNVAHVKQLGADYVFDYTIQDVVSECLAFTQGFGVDYVLEAADAALAVKNADALRFGGSICVLPGHMPISSEVFFRRQLSVSYVCIAGLHAHQLTRKNIRNVIEICMSLYQRGAFRLVLETVSLKRANSALDIISAGHTRGKIVLTDFHVDEEPRGDAIVGTRRRKQRKMSVAVNISNTNNTEKENV